MSTFAPDEAMSNSGNHPPLEELAAYIDGMLGEEEAARVAEHISECEDCFFVYSETVRFQLEHPSEEEDPVPNVIPFSRKTEEVPGPGRRAVAGDKRKRALPRWLGIAAAAVAVAVGIPLYRSLNPQNMPEATTAELLGPVQGSPDLQSHLYPLKTFRGHGGESEYNRQSFMVGVLLTDTRLSLEDDNREGAASRIWRIGKVLEESLEGTGADLTQEATRIEAGGELPQTLAKLDQWEKSAGESEGEERPEEEIWPVDPDYVTFGKWAEAARLAAVLRKPDFFQDRDNRRVLSYVLGSEEMAPAKKVVADLQEIERIWDKGDLQPRDFATLAEKFKAILEAYDFTA